MKKPYINTLYLSISDVDLEDVKLSVYTEKARYNHGEKVAVYKFAGYAEADVVTRFKPLKSKPVAEDDERAIDF